MVERIATPERRLLGLMRPYWGQFALSMATGPIASFLDGLSVVLLIPLLKQLFGAAGTLVPSSTTLEHLIDRWLGPIVAGASPGVAAARVVGLVVLALVLKNALSLLSKQLTSQIEEGLVRDLRQRLYQHLLHLDLGFFQRTRAGELVSTATSDADAAKGFVTAMLTAGFQNVALVMFSLYFLSLMSVRLTLLTLATAPILVIGIRLLLRRVRHHSRAWVDQRGEVTASISERLGAMRLVRAFGQERQEGERWRWLTDRYRKQAIRAQRYQLFPTMVSEVFGGLLIVFIIYAAATPAIVGQSLGPTVTVAFLATALRMMAPIKALAQAPATMAVAVAAASRVFAVLDRPETDRDLSTERPAKFERELAFDEVGFNYPDEPPVLEGVSFDVAKGHVVAIVGPSGAGKTTLLELVIRFHDPTSGRLLLDGVPLTEVTRSSLRAMVGVVSQDAILLNDSVRANIGYGRPEAGLAEIEAAARAANAAEFIADLPNGYDTLLGERGTRLSGGQRQRIAIARALLKDPPILILDEATSALDSESERLVQQAIDRLMAHRTVLVVAHRLATVRHADEIVVLEQGRVVERGTHQALMMRDGLYRRLHDIQFATGPIGERISG